jgi:hypothetical protein
MTKHRFRTRLWCVIPPRWPRHHLWPKFLRPTRAELVALMSERAVPYRVTKTMRPKEATDDQ